MVLIDRGQITCFVSPDGGLWRWAVHFGANPTDLKSCLNAWTAETRADAIQDGDRAAATAVMGLRLYGARVEYAGVIELQQNPIPDGEQVTLRRI
jgi:hypothetical protein